jgi:tetratricopeptide (TPR) repeat protein
MEDNGAIQIAIKHQQASRLKEAEAIYRQILSRNPKNVDALHLLGIIRRETGDLDQAIDLISRAIQGKPDFAQAHCNLGTALFDKGLIDRAISSYQRAIELRPGFAAAHSSVGNILHKAGRNSEAISSLRRAVQLNPHSAAMCNDLGNVLADQGQIDESVASFRRALQLNSDSAEIYYNFANALFKLTDDIDGVIELCYRAVQLNPRFADAYNTLGSAFQQKLMLNEAMGAYDRAIQFKPDFAEAHYNLAMALLKSGEFRRGWPEFEWRWKVPSRPPPPTFSQPQWNREPLNDKTILLHAEQGLGDTIQFIRYASLIAQTGGHVVVKCATELSRLLQRATGVSQTISATDQLPEFDFHCSLMSLPFMFATELSSIPSAVAYLVPEPNLVEFWRTRVMQLKGGLKIGLVWAGNPQHKGDRHRSIALQNLWPITKSEGVTFISLQKFHGVKTPEQSQISLVDWTNDLHDFADTAALIANLDLVIAVDTAVAHLAAAMAKPVWVMLPFSPDWRWMLNRNDSPWYPTMRLFRQSSSGDWNSVITQVFDALSLTVRNCS